MSVPFPENSRAIGLWLLACCLLLFLLVLVGGATRLTGSGLSIVEWRPVTGVVPPLSDQAWLQELEKYRQSPEYREINRGMSLDDFKTIYWWEWGHRLLARTLGLAFALPLLWFWVRGRIPLELRWPLAGILALGALQGWLGWYMVQSGLVDLPRVSPYRLAAHLGLALIIFALMFRLALQMLWPRPAILDAREPHRRTIARLYPALLTLVAATIVAGAFVAGLKAGHMYNTFPLMGGKWVPDGLSYLDPGWRNLFENPVTVQFIHRLLGIGTFLLVAYLWAWSMYRTHARAQRLAVHALMFTVLLQVMLGISTLLLQVPVTLGALHQGGAVVLLSAVLLVGHFTRPFGYSKRT